MSAKQVVIGLGSNISPRKFHIIQALKVLNEVMTLTETSSLFETPPWKVRTNQNNYYNLVAIFKDCSLSPEDLLKTTQKAEIQLGRNNKGTLLSRTIDIDILFYEHLEYKSHNLTIPHPLWNQRPFVYRLLAQCQPSTFLSRENMILLEKSLSTDIYPTFTLIEKKEALLKKAVRL